MHYYQFNIGDYIKQTAHLTPLEDICYRRLLDMYYETEQPISIETDRVSRRLRLDTETVEIVLNEFFELTEKGWESARCNREIKAYQGKAETARLNGKLGGRPPKTQPVIHRNPEETGSKAKHKPLTIKQEPLNKKQDKEKTVRFIQPSVDEVRNHIAANGYTFSPEAFVAFYDSNGWMVGKNKMKSWKAASVTWASREKGQTNGKHGQAGRKLSIADEIRGQARAHIEKLDREHREANGGAICQDGSIVQIESGGLSDYGW